MRIETKVLDGTGRTTEELARDNMSRWESVREIGPLINSSGEKPISVTRNEACGLFTVEVVTTRLDFPGTGPSGEIIHTKFVGVVEELDLIDFLVKPLLT